MTTSASATTVSDRCYHCGQAIPRFCHLTASIKGQAHAVCCHGCKAIAEYIEAQGAQAFYEYRGAARPEYDIDTKISTKINTKTNAAEHQWREFDKEQILRQYLSNNDGKSRVTLLVEGIYCASCAWLIDRVLRDRFDGISAQLNVDTHYLSLSWPQKEAQLKLSEILLTLQQIGYQARPVALDDDGETASLSRDAENKAMLKRLIIGGLGMMQVMTYAVASYLGEHQGIEPAHQRFLSLVSLLVATLVVFYAGKPFFIHALRDIKNRYLGMDVPVAIAIGAAYFPSVYHTLAMTSEPIYFDSAVMFVFFLTLGRYLEMRSRFQSTSSLAALKNMLPALVTVRRQIDDGDYQSTHLPPQQLRPGDRMSVAQGERIPCDAVILQGSLLVDQSMLTGELTPVLVTENQRLSAGTLIHSGSAEVEIRAEWHQSALMKVQKILESPLQSVSGNFAQMTSLANKFVVSILTLTLIVSVFWWFYQSDRVFEVALAMLIASCPCAFSLAAPVVSTIATRVLRDKGLLITDLQVLQRISQSTHWCFDKTGTLTLGKREISRVELFSDHAEQECLHIVAALEANSEHTIAQAFAHLDSAVSATQIEEQIGFGVSGVIDGQRVWCGRAQWVAEQADVQLPDVAANTAESLIALANENGLMAYVFLGDTLKSGAVSLCEVLAERAQSVAVLTGDRQSSAELMLKNLPVTKVIGDLTPEQKVDRVRELQGEDNCVVMVGDGVNDAPVLGKADVSIAMANGSELSHSQASVIVLGRSLSSIPVLFDVAKLSQTLIRQNVVWALGYNAIMLPLAACGMMSPWMAALGMSLSSLIVVFNARRMPSLMTKSTDQAIIHRPENNAESKSKAHTHGDHLSTHTA